MKRELMALAFLILSLILFAVDIKNLGYGFALGGLLVYWGVYEDHLVRRIAIHTANEIEKRQKEKNEREARDRAA